MNRRSFLRTALGAIAGLAVVPMATRLHLMPPIPIPAVVPPVSLCFQDFEAVIRQTINPIIAQQFEESATLYKRFAGGNIEVRQRGYRVPYYEPGDAWLPDFIRRHPDA